MQNKIDKLALLEMQEKMYSKSKIVKETKYWMYYINNHDSVPIKTFSLLASPHWAIYDK